MSTLLTCYYRPKPGGLCRRLLRGMTALAERGHEVHYLAVEELPIRHPRCRFHRLRAPTRRRGGLLFWTWFGLAAPPVLLWLGVRHRVAGLFAFGAFYGLLLQPLRRLGRRPLTVLLRADSITNHRLAGYPRWALALERRVEAAGLGGARILAVSDSLASTLAARHRRIPPRRIGVLRNDVPPPLAPPASGPPAAPLRAAAVGILEPRKDLSLLLRAMAAQPHGAAVVLTLYGDGPERGVLERQVAAQHLADRVVLAGWKAPEEIWRQVDLLLMPSRHEGAPNAVLEALAHRIPVLASDLPEHREILPAGCLLPAGDTAAWTERLRRLAASPARELEELRLRQQRDAERLRFDWDAAFVAALEGAAAPSAGGGGRRPED